MTLRRVLLTISGGGGAVSNRAFVKPAIALSTRITLRAATVLAGVRVSVLTALRVPVKPALAVTQRASGTMRSTVAPAPRLTTRATLLAAPSRPALDLVQIKYDLVQTKGADVNVSSGTWNAPANALGRRNGTIADRTGDAVSAVDQTLTLGYANHVAKTPLTIQSVVLKFYWKHSSSLAISTSTLSYSLGGASTNLLVQTASLDALLTPSQFDITAAVAGSWTTLDLLQTAIRFQAPATTGATDFANVDSVECVVTATVTDAI